MSTNSALEIVFGGLYFTKICLNIKSSHCFQTITINYINLYLIHSSFYHMQTPFQLNFIIPIIDQQYILIMKNKICIAILDSGKHFQKCIAILLLSSKNDRDNYKSIKIHVNLKLWNETKLSEKQKISLKSKNPY